jgi:apolipoprotein N-acyltransferase
MAHARDGRNSSAATIALLILATIGLLTLSAAPFGQCYLAWIAFVPWLVAVERAPTIRAALWRGWLAGTIYFALNEWWLWTATIPGTVGVIVCSGFYWGLAAAVIKYTISLSSEVRADDRSLKAVARIVGVAAIWTATEWLRCNTVSEFPWLPVGCTQSSVVVMCQIADFAGVWGITFWVLLVNALVATAWFHRNDARYLRVPGITIAAALLMIAVYGIWRISETPEQPGPRIMLLQSNHPHIRGGASTATPDVAAKFFLSELESRLAQERVDLVILPENEFPPLNAEARTELARSTVGPILEQTYQRLKAVAREHAASILVGGAAVTGWKIEGKEHIGTEIRNSAYFFAPEGEAVARYDKIRLVPYSERLPFATGPRWLTNAMLFLAASRAMAPLHPGNFDDFQPFVLSYSPRSSVQREARFVTPICLENADPAMSRCLIRDPTTGRKRADFFANLSNDGWFHDQEKSQHLQLLVFRCIENRVPLARSSNTGISAFIDSCGRVQETIESNTVGSASRRINLDSRETFYTRYGDVFPIGCLVLVGFACAARLIESRRRARAQNRATSAEKRDNSLA